jgi:hypothetical protein
MTSQMMLSVLVHGDFTPKHPRFPGFWFLCFRKLGVHRNLVAYRLLDWSGWILTLNHALHKNVFYEHL